nr:uncharacterized protein LOC107438050 [Parasteatoda tepidariorum]
MIFDPLILSKNANTEKKSHSSSKAHFSNEMSQLFKNFNNDLNEIMQNKRMYFEKFVQDTMEKTSEKLSKSDILQNKERVKRIEHFETEFYEIMKQATQEMERLKTIEEKIQSLLTTKKHKRDAEKQAYLDRLHELKKLNEEFCQKKLSQSKTENIN